MGGVADAANADDGQSLNPFAEVKQQSRQKRVERIELSEAEALDAYIDTAASVAVVDSSASKFAKKQLNALEKALSTNTLQRSQHPNAPERFMDSEVVLHKELKALMSLTSSDEVSLDYLAILSTNAAVQTFISLICHDNVDICIACIEVLQELTDEDVTANDGRKEQAVAQFIIALVDGDVVQALVQILERLASESVQSDNDEERGVFATLSIVENVSSLSPESCDVLAESTKIISWLLSRLSAKTASSNRYYSAEILCILLQISASSRKIFLSLSGMETILSIISKRYRKRDPDGDDEEEEMANLSGALYALISGGAQGSFLIEARESFLEYEGPELMVLMIKAKRMASISALKTLSFATSGLLGAGTKSVCDRLVDTQALSLLFSALLKKDSKRNKKSYSSIYNEADEEESVITVLNGLARFLDDKPPQFRLIRFVQKFVEKEHEAIRRLVEIRVAAAEKLRKVDDDIALQRRELIEQGEDVDGDSEDAKAWRDEVKIERLNGGLAMLHNVGLLILFLCSQIDADGRPVQTQVFKCLKQSKAIVQDTVDVCRDYSRVLVEDISSEDTSLAALSARNEFERVSKMIENIASE